MSLPSFDHRNSRPVRTSDPSSSSSSSTSMPHPRPASPFVFGDATPQNDPAPVSQGQSQLRKLLHSPHEYDRHQPRRTLHSPPNFDFSMRRHSIAVGANSITLPHLASSVGSKRKMSGDRAIFHEEDSPHLVGPGMPSMMEVDTDAPAPKRRGSTIDTQRIAQLTISDRRNSVDSRGSWLLNDRRESAPSLFPSVPPISSLPQPDSPQQPRLPPSMATYSWGDEPAPRPFDTHLPLPLNYPPDRRMSVPDALTHPMSSRNLRSRSRPPSRQGTDGTTQSGPSSGQEDRHDSPPTPPAGGLRKEGQTPYSRSPELRISHKLAERKRRKEMKDLFDELRDQLPADRGMKASKWEILSKAIDFVIQLKRSHQEISQELEMLRQQVDGSRPGGGHPSFSQSSSSSNYPFPDSTRSSGSYHPPPSSNSNGSRETHSPS